MSSWTVNPRKYAVELADQHRRIVSHIALDIQTRLTLKTPVDTGRARANWLGSVGSPSAESTLNTDALSAYASAASKFDPKKIPYFPVLYITNNLSYIEALNNGWSQQAPAHFVEMSILEASGVF